MTRHALVLGAVVAAALAVCLSASPATTASETRISAMAGTETVPLAQTHGLIGASFHAASTGF